MDNLGFVDGHEADATVPEGQQTKGILNSDDGKLKKEKGDEPTKKIIVDLSPKEKSASEVQLKQSIGLPSAIGIIISNVIGTGIFISPQGVLRGSGSIGLSLIIWVLAGLLSLFGALTYAELGTLINDSGGTYIYLLEGFSPGRNNNCRQWGSIPAFLYNWQHTLFSNPASMAIIALSCGEYLVRLSDTWMPKATGVPGESSELAVKLIAATVLCMVAAVNCYSVRLSTLLQNLSAFLKLLTVFAIIMCGILKGIQSPSTALASGFQDTNLEYGDIALALYSGLWAYNGWQNLNYVIQEMKHSARDLPRAIIPANFLVVLCYLLVNVSYLVVLNKWELLQSETVAVGFGYRVAGKLGEVVMILFVASAAFGSAASGCFSAGRLCYVAAREGHMLVVFSYIHKNYLTPTSAIIFNLILCLLMIVPSDISSLISLSGFTTWFFIGATQIALLIMRRTRKEDHRTIKVNILIPVIVLLASIFLVVTPILDRPQLSHFYILGFLLIGLLVYFPLVHFRLVLPGTEYFTKIVQKFLHVVPPAESKLPS